MRVARILQVGVLAAMMGALAGCETEQAKANDRSVAAARQAAIATGDPQTVSWTDNYGNEVRVLVEPPAPGQREPRVIQTVSKYPDPSRVQVETAREGIRQP